MPDGCDAGSERRMNRADNGAQEQLPLQICEQAMEWWLKTHGQKASASTLAALERWRNESRLHEIAWHRAQALAGQMNAFRQNGDAGLAKRALLSADSTGMSRRRAIKSLAVLLAAGTAAWAARDTALVQRVTADYSTGVGEQRKVALSSQIELELNTRSAVNVQHQSQQWQIELLRGEVLIDTRAMPPLLMKAAQIEARATAARFSTRLFDNGNTLFSVYRGSLQVSSAQGITLLNQGQQARFGPLALLERGTLEQTSAPWAEGMIVAHGQPLEEFLQDLGRYRYGHLSCDPALSGLRVWGTFPLADSDRVINAVADTLKLDVQRFTRLWVNLRQRERSA
jgi:transmembrane sensor